MVTEEVVTIYYIIKVIPTDTKNALSVCPPLETYGKTVLYHNLPVFKVPVNTN